jgi:SulP family sulfate permease
MSSRPGLSGGAIAQLLRFAPNLRGASRAFALRDGIAGLTVAALAIPQGLAFALVAGVPPRMGLLAAAIPATVGALFGSSPLLVTGPTNPISIVVATSIVVPALARGVTDPTSLVLGTGLVAGLILLVFAGVGLGRASRFLSDSVIAGFAVGAGIEIAFRLLPELGPPSVHAEAASRFLPKIWPVLLESLRALSQADPRALALAAAVPACVVAARQLDARIPGALLSIGASIVAVRLLGWTQGDGALAVIGPIDVGFPKLALPALLAPSQVAAPALAIAMLATLQSIAAARAIQPPGRERLDPDRELVGQGAANLAAAFLGALPTCGSLTRSAHALTAGAHSRLAAATGGIALAVLLPSLGGIVAQVPIAAVVGLVVLSGVDLVNPGALRRSMGTRGDAAVLIATLIAALWIDLVQALYAGVFLSLALLVRRAGRLQMVEIVRADGGRFREIPLDERTGGTPAVLLHLEGDLNFAVATELSERISEIAERSPRVLVLRLKRARHVDATVLEALRHVFAELRGRGLDIILCGLTDEVAQRFEASELASLLGSECLLRAGPRLFEGFERALVRTRKLLRPLTDDEIFRYGLPAAGPAPIDYGI